MVGMSDFFGMTGPQSPEEEQRLQDILKRVMQTSQAAMGGLDERTERQLPFGLMVQQDEPSTQPKTPARPTSSAPTTTPFRTTLEPSEQLETTTNRNMSVPQTAPIVKPNRQAAANVPSEANPRPSGQQVQSQNVPRAPEPGFWDRVGALARGYNTGGLIGGLADALGPNLERQAEQGNMTIQALVKQGVPPEMAAVAARNPDVMKLMLAQMFNKVAPEFKEIEVKDRYGRTTKIPVTYNQATRRWEKIDIDGSGATAPGASAGDGGLSVAPSAPAGVGAPGVAGGPPMPAAPGANLPAGGVVPSGYKVDKNIPISSLPAAPKGRAYDDRDGYALTDQNGNLKMISEKELEARNPSEDAAKLRDMLDGIDKTYNAANDLIYHPGLPATAGRNLAGEAKFKGIGLDLGDLYAGTDVADAFNDHKALLSDVALRTMDRLKSMSATGATGFGALSEKELEILTQSAGNLKLSTSYEKLVENYKAFQTALLKSRERLMQKFQDKYGQLPEGLTTKQQLIDQATQSQIDKQGRQTVRPRNFLGFDIPGTSTTEPRAGTAPSAPLRGVPNTPPPGARDLPPGAGYPPGAKAVPNPNNPKQWIIWTPD